MGQNTGTKGKRKREEVVKEEEKEKEEVQVEQDVLSVHSPCKSLPSSLSKEQLEVELELRVLEALEIYHPAKLQGIHRHFVLYGLTEYLRRSFNKHFSADEVLKLLDRFYNLEMLEADDDVEILNQEEDFCLPPSFFSKEES
ncbi:unnamed protein product [Cuscuta epithymum]|uniref:Uncharacterized protein n=1 Tax=Cuscuta epithymum TaxID=186058 RepID=A0AAV0ENW7_9ASTE|nr:unnamed protein product [Cuscuta epithymum]CAH9123977.1 unnamed protein product [Cuscuta epithymum]